MTQGGLEAEGVGQGRNLVQALEGEGYNDTGKKDDVESRVCGRKGGRRCSRRCLRPHPRVV